jgi:hypothetical protein
MLGIKSKKNIMGCEILEKLWQDRIIEVEPAK